MNGSNSRCPEITVNVCRPDARLGRWLLGAALGGSIGPRRADEAGERDGVRRE
jgi:hypothetical protein